MADLISGWYHKSSSSTQIWSFIHHKKWWCHRSDTKKEIEVMLKPQAEWSGGLGGKQIADSLKYPMLQKKPWRHPTETPIDWATKALSRAGDCRDGTICICVVFESSLKSYMGVDQIGEFQIHNIRRTNATDHGNHGGFLWPSLTPRPFFA